MDIVRFIFTSKMSIHFYIVSIQSNKDHICAVRMFHWWDFPFCLSYLVLCIAVTLLPLG